VTITYDPKHAAYLDEADVRDELTRVFGVCDGCRRCVMLCSSFPSLFAMLDRAGVAGDVRDAGTLTPSEQDRVIDECFQCRLCRTICPYVPGSHELAIDFPRLMSRARAMRHAAGQRTITAIVADQLLGRPDLFGKVATRVAPAINRVVGADSGTMRRRMLARATGITAQRRLAPYARRRFSSTLRKRRRTDDPTADARVTVFPTCLVEYRRSEIGRALVDAYAHRGIACDIAGVVCCGASWLTAGDIRRFAAVAARNVATLANAIRAGTDVVVAQPTCHAVITTDYRDHVGGSDAELVATRTFDAVQYLADHSGDRLVIDGTPDTRFIRGGPTRIVHHEPCGGVQDETPSPARRLLELTGATVTDVHRRTGVDGRWGLRVANEQIGLAVVHELAVEIQRAAADVFTGGCVLTNIAIEEQTGRSVIHPLELLATAYRGPTAEDADG
jgi:Fe-S oxidoreductase